MKIPSTCRGPASPRRTSRGGFTIFFAVLVSSLALAVGVAIYDLVSRELVLSQTTTQSQYAIFAADTGVECALYWDSKYVPPIANGFTSIFAAYPRSVTGLVEGVAMCNGQDIYQYGNGTPPNPYTLPTTGWGNWTQGSTTDTVTTTYTLDLPPGCAVVQVTKVGNPAQTTIVSRGYNTCAKTGVVRIERALQISY